jgi:aspartate racemase
MSKTIGILGGMGPEATAYVFNLIVSLTRADKDQEHLRSIVFNNPGIPDRTAAILGDGPSPLPHLIEGAKVLENAGAGFIFIPCVTAHHYFDQLVGEVSIPFLNLLKETRRHIEREYGRLEKIAVLATDGTIQTGLFQKFFSDMEIITPGNSDQQLLMKVLYHKEGIKAGYKEQPREIILQVLNRLLSHRRPQAVIAGCTEIPLVIGQPDMDIPFVDPLSILALQSIRLARKK